MKKKNSVKILSVLLAVLLLGGMVPLAAAAEEAQTVMVSVKGTYIPPKMEEKDQYNPSGSVLRAAGVVGRPRNGGAASRGGGFRFL